MTLECRQQMISCLPSIQFLFSRKVNAHTLKKLKTKTQPYQGHTTPVLKTKFEMLLEQQTADGKQPWEPFASKEEWQLATWLMANMGQTSTDEYLKLPILAHPHIDYVRERSNLSFHNNYTFLKEVDVLPTGPSWKCEILRAKGDLIRDDGQPLVEELELWWRDPVECVKELVGNLAFKKFMLFIPEQVFSDKEGKERVLDEM
ncbi:uncharacterized protein LACBIDRAFT_323307 [Laccaria bicolor S238N-H82]|uniref:Predicted protein n=1 Tax=Laccaria bicolor (strain S238N-H82 / ATCC MYA-4686) TaxID=486041 RepID=B0CZT1_LACBS|nr:uncharacterized protein LACBIDRAFT_323307 [Laccaria bicolor S238N-H82]EDR12671.1 predicted protein [Laccaria bicolor S238N-H82]|eukprot:XP_001876935.1 predicted protein [Laccaria bicolor S238N-H82]